jgi:hypothetical protein
MITDKEEHLKKINTPKYKITDSAKK